MGHCVWEVHGQEHGGPTPQVDHFGRYGAVCAKSSEEKRDGQRIAYGSRQ